MSTVAFTLPTTTLPVGTETIPGPTAEVEWGSAALVIDRTVSGGLNSLTADTTLDLVVQYSTDGTTWTDGAHWRCYGGSVAQPSGWGSSGGSPLDSETLGFGIDGPFAAGTQFQVEATVIGNPVVVAAQVVYD